MAHVQASHIRAGLTSLLSPQLTLLCRVAGPEDWIIPIG
jgi:hypothetical protein